MRPVRKQAKVRINLDMPVEVKELLEQIRDETHADSMGEVMRRAVFAYAFLLGEQKTGSTVVIRAPDSSEKGLPLF